ncbi:MAG: capsule assembly Wzi family protein [Muribaculaceae bacterium]|nr:capsule assembly Wzi family protein [Muribaculaceae bacterium]
MNNFTRIILLSVALAVAVLPSKGEYPVNYTTEVMANAGNGTFAPYYMTANRHGILTQSKGLIVHAGAWRPLDTSSRFSYDFGLDIFGGVTNNTEYSKWHSSGSQSGQGEWNTHAEHPAYFWIQQVYASLKYRCLYINAGMKDRDSYMLDSYLSSGDMIQSGNARSVPQVRAGFIDFQNIPFTNGWLQIQGEVAYGIYCQNKWFDNHFDYFTGVMTKNMLFNYKRLYFRTNPAKPFSATFGGQGAGQFGGTSFTYSRGVLTGVDRHSRSLKSFWQALIPHSNGVEGYFEGQHLGSWDIKLRYRLRNKTEISAYVQNLWEDGTGMGKLNGWDGLWGLEYRAPRKGWLDAAVIEYLQTTNQSGPLHWDPADVSGTTLNIGQATGSDNYYNNGFYGAYANFGMAQGNPLLKSPIFYTKGGILFQDNRVKALHVGLCGSPAKGLTYRLLGSYRTSWGSYAYPRLEKLHSASFLAEAIYSLPSVNGLDLKGELGVDHGKLFGNRVGLCVTVSYSGLLNF